MHITKHLSLARLPTRAEGEVPRSELLVNDQPSGRILAGAVLEAAVLGAAYSTGSFSDLSLLPPDTVRFRFIGGTDWTVRLLHKDQFRLPLVSEPRGVSRRLGFSRRFVVDGDPQPQGR